MKGFFYPRTASGDSSLIPSPPWFYSGDLLTVEYRTDTWHPLAVGGRTALTGTVAFQNRSGLVRLVYPSGAQRDYRGELQAVPSGTALTTVNLARRLTDGEQVLVGLPPPAGQVDPAGAVGVPPSGGRRNTNSRAPKRNR